MALAESDDDNTWISTERLLNDLPGSMRVKRKYLSYTFAGKREIAHEVPIRRALAIAATVDAHHRGVTKPERIFDLISRTPGGLRGMLVVIARGKPPYLLPGDGFGVQSVVVIDLDELRGTIGG